MNRTLRATVLGLAALGFLLLPAPGNALCTGNCGGTEECPECVFSAFFSYRCAGRPCRWCAVWECSVAAPSQPGDQLAQWLRNANVAPAASCAAATPAEIAGRDTQARVVRLETRL